jgi:hypothetical protein
LKYAHVASEHGGPLRAVSYSERVLPEGKLFEAIATLNEANLGLRSPLGKGPHGGALAPQKPDALHAAISEALETWAWSAARENAALAKPLRLDLDSTRAGFAAFPGLGMQGARKRAYFEAAERWALGSWWEGRLAHAKLGESSIKIVPPIPGACVVVIWAVQGGKTHFGIGTSHGPLAATERARISLQRNRDRMEREPGTSVGRRLEFFSRPEGTAAFRKRLELRGGQAAAPVLAVDSAVLGPWQQYAHVWRCLFDCSGFQEKNKDDYFLF